MIPCVHHRNCAHISNPLFREVGLLEESEGATNMLAKEWVTSETSNEGAILGGKEFLETLLTSKVERPNLDGRTKHQAMDHDSSTDARWTTRSLIQYEAAREETAWTTPLPENGVLNGEGFWMICEMFLPGPRKGEAANTQQAHVVQEATQQPLRPTVLLPP